MAKETFGSYLKQLRESRGLTMGDLGRIINTHHANINNYESNKRWCATNGIVMYKIVDALKLTEKEEMKLRSLCDDKSSLKLKDQLVSIKKDMVEADRLLSCLKQQIINAGSFSNKMTLLRNLEQIIGKYK